MRIHAKPKLPLSLFLIILLLPLTIPQALAREKPHIRFGVLSIAPPARIYAKWQPFADYMSQQLGQSVEIVVPRGFAKLKKTIEAGGVDFFYTNSLVFYRLKQAGQVQAVAQMKNIEGKTTSRSELFVRRDSGIEDVADLKGKSIAYVSPMGAGGYLAPRALMYKSGVKSGIETNEKFTKNLSNSLHGVLLGDYAAGTMCGVNYNLMSRKIETGELKIIAVSDEYPENVMGARKKLPAKLVENFKQGVLSMKDNPQGLKVLRDMRSMKIDSFVKYDAAMEKITEQLLATGKL